VVTQPLSSLMRTISTHSKVCVCVCVRLSVLLYAVYLCSLAFHFKYYFLIRPLLRFFLISFPNVSLTRTPSITSYVITGIVAHVGAIDRGHYYSFIKERSTDKWLEFNDRTVLPFSAEVNNILREPPCSVFIMLLL
jgi:Ubiquitin carboxyl-terminal hydrolase